ncbi:hypothetical protein DNA40_25165 [Salmonella enterica subsp. enterica serovar Schwarzengrund]|nr:hypothetical protein [Salmonella enterica subsp. enterica serovar Schwarzengrund]
MAESLTAGVIGRRPACGLPERWLGRAASPAEMPESFIVSAGAAAPGSFFSPSVLSLVQIRKWLKNGADHDDLQCEFTGPLQSMYRLGDFF